MDLLERLAPVLGFLVGLTVLAELADEAEVFDVVAARAARLGRGNPLRLFLWTALIATVSTVTLSLDTTAVLLTPVALAMATRLGLPPLPFAMLTVWLANTASLLLPISNLTNLLAQDSLDLSATAYAHRLLAPALTAVVMTVALLAFRYRVALRGAYELPAPHEATDPVLLRAAALACLAVVPATLLGLAPWTVALPAAAALAAVFAWRRPAVLRLGLVPWQLCVLVVALAAVVTALDLTHLGLGDDGLRGTLQTGFVSAGLANGVNNLPAYLGLEHALPGGDDRLLAVLLGVDLGPLVLLHGSLATLLWRARCRARGLHVSAREFAVVGMTTMPLVLAGSLLVLHLS